MHQQVRGLFQVNNFLCFLLFSLVGCAGASEGKKIDWPGGPVRTSSCAADCAEWDSEGKICLSFHDWTSERCARILSRELDRF